MTILDTAYEKKGESILVTIRTVTTESRSEHTLEDLKNQRLAILRSIDDFISARKTELAEVDEMISEAQKLGIIEKVASDTTKAEINVADVLK